MSYTFKARTGTGRSIRASSLVIQAITGTGALSKGFSLRKQQRLSRSRGVLNVHIRAVLQEQLSSRCVVEECRCVYPSQTPTRLCVAFHGELDGDIGGGDAGDNDVGDMDAGGDVDGGGGDLAGGDVKVLPWRLRNKYENDSPPIAPSILKFWLALKVWQITYRISLSAFIALLGLFSVFLSAFFPEKSLPSKAYQGARPCPIRRVKLPHHL